jgi:hypothetical protein
MGSVLDLEQVQLQVAGTTLVLDPYMEELVTLRAQDTRKAYVNDPEGTMLAGCVVEVEVAHNGCVETVWRHKKMERDTVLRLVPVLVLKVEQGALQNEQ